MTEVTIPMDEALQITAPEDIELDWDGLPGMCLYYQESNELEFQFYGHPEDVEIVMDEIYGDQAVFLDGVAYLCVEVPATATAEEYAAVVLNNLRNENQE